MKLPGVVQTKPLASSGGGKQPPQLPPGVELGVVRGSRGTLGQRARVGAEEKVEMVF